VKALLPEQTADLEPVTLDGVERVRRVVVV
jgi:hypothetical protein